MTHLSSKRKHKQIILEHINSVDLAISFTVEDSKEDGAIPFLDTIVKPEADNTLSITVYGNPTHIDQYLQWDSHCHLSAKYNTLTHRASMQQAGVFPKGNGPLQEGTQSLQVPQMGHGQGGKKALTAYQWGK